MQLANDLIRVAAVYYNATAQVYNHLLAAVPENHMFTSIRMAFTDDFSLFDNTN